MEIIAVTGSGLSNGRTKLGVQLIENLRTKVGVLKGHVVEDKSEMLTDDQNIMRAEVPEISPYLKVKVDNVVYLRTSEARIKEMISEAMGMFSDLDYLILEGNKLVQYMSPGVVIYVREEDEGQIQSCVEISDLIVDYIELQNNSDLTDLRLTVPGETISCYRAQLISDLFGLGYGEFGSKLDRDGIRVTRCQLGLFK
ncbi:MAG: hypothetical protein ACQEQG_00835 [Bacillota bacterium]